MALLIESYLSEREVDNICYLAENTGYGQDVISTAEAAFGDSSVSFSFSELFERDETEFPQTVAVGAAGCETVVVGSLMPAAVNVTAALQDSLPDTDILHASGICNGEFLSLDPGVVEGLVATCPKLLVSPDSLPDDDEQKEVLTRYRDEYEAFTGEDVNSFGGHAWDAAQWAILALESLEGDVGDGAARRTAIRDALETEVEDFIGTGGVITLSPDDHIGITDTETALTTVQVIDGEFVLLPKSEWVS